jgi:hypothetical protein
MHGFSSLGYSYALLFAAKTFCNNFLGARFYYEIRHLADKKHK